MEKITESLRKAKRLIEMGDYPNVQGVGIGYKIKDGKKTKELAVIVFVNKKIKEIELSPKALIPKTVCTNDGDIKIDVVESGEFAALALTDRVRPVVPGYSVGHPDITAGTAGLVVKKVQDGKLCILSNNHVLANVNKANIGDPIIQPGSYDNGKVPNDIVAHLDNFIRVETSSTEGKFTNFLASIFNFVAEKLSKRSRLMPINIGENLVDCAIASFDNEADVCYDCYKIGRPTGIREGELDMKVRKSGRTTEYTESEIIAVDATLNVLMGSEFAVFSDQLIAGKMCDGGDSGSAVFDEGTNVIGLLFAGGQDTTIINRIQNVFEALKIELP